MPVPTPDLVRLVDRALGPDAQLVGELEWFDYAKSSPLWSSRVRTGAAVLPVIIKDGSQAALLSGAARVKPPFLHDPRREAAVYRSVLAGRPGPPRLLGAHVERQADGSARSVLVVERIRGLELCDVGEVDVWAQAAAWFGSFHASATEKPDVPLVIHDAGSWDRWQAQAAAAARTLHPESRALVEIAVDRFAGRGRAVLDAATVGVVHGEAYPSNVVVGGARIDGTIDTASLRVSPIDWETAGWGPVLLDLAALTTGDLRPDDRARIVSSYRAAATAGGLDFADFDAELDACRLALALQWIAWFVADNPPAHQARDWAREAAAAADALGDRPRAPTPLQTQRDE